jgi:hypothetical protein
MTYIDNGGLAALLEWIGRRGPEPGPLFCPVDQRGQVSIRRLTGQAVYMRSSSLGMPASPLLPAMTGGPSTPSAGRLACCTSPGPPRPCQGLVWPRRKVSISRQHRP